MKSLSNAERRRVLDQILKTVRQHKTFFLSGHERPDGDTLGSQLAFASFLRRQGKKVTICNADPVPHSLRFLKGSERVLTSKKCSGHYDVAVIFECSGPERMGNILDLKTQATVVINIDHHAHHRRFGDINLIDPTASSNSEQLFYLFERARMPLTREEATALYVGLVTDTGRFQQSNTSSESYRIAGELLKRKIPLAEISRAIYGTRSLPALKLMARALDHLSLELEGRVAFLSLECGDFSKTGAREDDTEDLVNFGLMIPSAQVSVFLKENEDQSVKVSFRGKGEVDLCRVAVSMGGGGHRNASGCVVDGPMDKAKTTVLQALRSALRPA